MTRKPSDPIWEMMRQEATEGVAKEPMLSSFLYAVILNHKRLEDALSFQLASKLESVALAALNLRELIDNALNRDTTIGEAVRADVLAVRERDPACRFVSNSLLYFKGFLALQTYRIAHYYWNHERQHLAFFLQNRMTEVFSVDIHPAARIGKGILIDHATGVVIGETSVVADNVSMLHAVTLGGTGKELGDRHPKIREGVLLGAGAKVLGNIIVGEGAKIAAGSVVLSDVPPRTSVAGAPAKPIGRTHEMYPALDMDQRLDDYYYEAGDGL
jgi:serine O-acetyltransferase